MEIYLDNDRFETGAATLGGVIDAAGVVLAERGRIVVEVRLDGETLDADRLTDLQDQVPPAEELQLISAEPGALSRVTLLEARDALVRAGRQQQSAAERLQADDLPAALKEVRQVLAVWSQARMAVDLSVKMTGLALESIEVDGRTAEQIIAHLADLLTELKEQLAGQDWIGLADTLAYPLGEAVEQWSAMIDALCETIQNR